MNICIICYDKIENQDLIIFKNCIHGIHVHYSCIKNWNNTCPICRKPIYQQQINYNFVWYNIIYDIINYLIEIIINLNNNDRDIITYVITTR